MSVPAGTEMRVVVPGWGGVEVGGWFEAGFWYCHLLCEVILRARMGICVGKRRDV